MPKDEFDAEDPLELVACEVPLEETHVAEMAACFIEEFRRMGWSAAAIYALSCEPGYHGPHTALERLGDARVRALIEQEYGAGALAGVFPVIPVPSGAEGKE
jgi:hypothetical protein